MQSIYQTDNRHFHILTLVTSDRLNWNYYDSTINFETNDDDISLFFNALIFCTKLGALIERILATTNNQQPCHGNSEIFYIIILSFGSVVNRNVCVTSHPRPCTHLRLIHI